MHRPRAPVRARSLGTAMAELTLAGTRGSRSRLALPTAASPSASPRRVEGGQHPHFPPAPSHGGAAPRHPWPPGCVPPAPRATGGGWGGGCHPTASLADAGGLQVPLLPALGAGGGAGSAPALATSPAFQFSAQISLRGAGCLAPKSPARAKNNPPAHTHTHTHTPPRLGGWQLAPLSTALAPPRRGPGNATAAGGRGRAGGGHTQRGPGGRSWPRHSAGCPRLPRGTWRVLSPGEEGGDRVVTGWWGGGWPSGATGSSHRHDWERCQALPGFSTAGRIPAVNPGGVSQGEGSMFSLSYPPTSPP